jgi:cytochrome c biogenesis protein CcmG/thiol:disulfide interchange protein DsbE
MTEPKVPREGDPAPKPDSAAAPAPARRRTPREWLRHQLHWSNLIIVAALIYAGPTLLPHIGALFGVRSGPQEAPRFAYPSLTGELLSSDSLRGKVVLVNFWATWCAPCRAEMPVLEAMYKRHQADGFVIVGLAVDQAPTAEVEAFVRDRGVSYPVAHVGREAEAVFGGVRGYPTSFLIGRDGMVRHRVLGPIGAVSLEPAVRRALAQR